MLTGSVPGQASSDEREQGQRDKKRPGTGTWKSNGEKIAGFVKDVLVIMCEVPKERSAARPRSRPGLKPTDGPWDCPGLRLGRICGREHMWSRGRYHAQHLWAVRVLYREPSEPLTHTFRYSHSLIYEVNGSPLAPHSPPKRNKRSKKVEAALGVSRETNYPSLNRTNQFEKKVIFESRPARRERRRGGRYGMISACLCLPTWTNAADVGYSNPSACAAFHPRRSWYGDSSHLRSPLEPHARRCS